MSTQQHTNGTVSVSVSVPSSTAPNVGAAASGNPRQNPPNAGAAAGQGNLVNAAQNPPNVNPAQNPPNVNPAQNPPNAGAAAGQGNLVIPAHNLPIPAGARNEEVIISITIHRISRIDPVNESFHAKFNTDLWWRAKEGDLKDDDSEISDDTKKNAKNLLNFSNVIGSHTAPTKTKFYIITGKRNTPFFTGIAANPPDDERYVRATLEYDLDFAEDFEMKNFPFDHQDLTIMIGDTTQNFQFAPPKLEEMTLCTFDTRHSPIFDAWELTGLAVDFLHGAFNDNDDDEFAARKYECLKQCGCKKDYQPLTTDDDDHDQRPAKELVVSVKLRRYWWRVALRECSVVFILALMAVGVFTIHEDYQVERVNYIQTVLLTMVLNDAKTPTKSYLTLFDIYTALVYTVIFMCGVLVIFERYALDEEWYDLSGNFALYLAFSFSVLVHLWFCCYVKSRTWHEGDKSKRGYFGVKRVLKNQRHVPRKKFGVDAGVGLYEEHSDTYIYKSGRLQRSSDCKDCMRSYCTTKVITIALVCAILIFALVIAILCVNHDI